MLTRKKLTQDYRVEIEKKWLEYFWHTVHNYFKIDSISFSNLSSNPNITLDTILKNTQYNWSYDDIARNPNINFTIVKQNPHLKWNYQILSHNRSISWTDILNAPDLPWDWRNLAEKANIKIETIRQHFTEFNPKLLIHNPSITLEMIDNNSDLEWDWDEIPMRNDLTFSQLFEMVEKYEIPLLEKHWIVISSQKYIYWHHVLENSNFPWRYDSLSYNPNITFEIINENPQYPWSWKYFSYNPNFKLEYLLFIPSQSWDWEYISENHITPEFLKSFPHFPYCYHSIQMNPLFTFQDIISYPSIKPNMNYLTLNPAITLEDIRDNRGYTWDWFWLSSCNFEIDKKKFILTNLRRWLAAYRIQLWYQKIRHSPQYKYGRKYINSLYDKNLR